VGCVRLYTEAEHADTVMLNLGWTIYNLVIIGGALAVAAERRQVRHAVRVRVRLPALLRPDSGAPAIAVNTLDVSYSGVALEWPEDVPAKAGDSFQVVLLPQRSDVWLNCRVRRAGHKVLALEFEHMDVAQESALVNAL